jgi:hypothetical protein
MRWPVRRVVSGVGLALLLAAWAEPAGAQFSTDARRIGLGGLSLQRGPLARYNVAYRAVPEASGEEPRVTIPLPLGIIQALNDSTATDVDSPYFNPMALANWILNPPLFLEIKRVEAPSSDVELTIGRNQLIIDLHEAQAAIPADEFGFGSSSRLFEVPISLPGGLRFGVSAFLQYEAGFQLDDSLRAVLKDGVPVQPDSRYGMLLDDQVQFGVAPGVSWARRMTGNEERGLYVGGAVRYYMGAAFVTMQTDLGFRTDTVIFAGGNPVRPDVDALVQRSTFDGLGSGFGIDLGAVWVSGRLEVGVGVNDIGATLTWKDVTIERHVFDSVTNDIQRQTLATGAEAKTRLPTSFLINARYSFFTGTTVGADVLETGRGTTIHVGGEHQLGPVRARAGFARDERHKIQFGWGGGVRFGPIGLDLGFWTHSRSFSNERGVTMATSLSIY